MCGITGVVTAAGISPKDETLKSMTDAIAHRGPDGEGIDIQGNVGLGHRRLAIIDLSEDAAQPMEVDDGKFAITYNGEVYNFQEIRTELEAAGHSFRSQSDTEVVLRSYIEWGKDCLDKFNGMFAFAIHDRKNQELFLARDRYGVKPLYWHQRDGLFLFGSEIKSMLAHGELVAEMCLPALSEYLTFQNIFSDLTLFDGVRILEPGHFILLDTESLPNCEPQLYWDYNALASPMADKEMEQCVQEVEQLMREGVERQLISDVPVSSYLSSGIDSGAIAAIASKALPHMRTFTVGFDLSSASGLELGFDEREKAEALSNHFKTEHYEVILHAGDMERVVPKLVWHLEDLRVGQCYPNYYAAGLAGKFGKVVLSGAGGDELFAGYPWRYYRGLRSADKDDYLAKYYEYWQRLVADEDRPSLFKSEIWEKIKTHSPRDSFRSVFDGWDGGYSTNEDQLHASLYFELKTFLHGLLVVEDRLSMAHGLETRVPLLDNKLVDYALKIPAALKLKEVDTLHKLDENQFAKRHRFAQEHDRGKHVFRAAMQHVLPEQVAARKKQGFSGPDASWFRGESIDYVDRLLRNENAAIYDYLRQEQIILILDEHESGKVNHRLLIWSLLSLELWCRIFLRGEIPMETENGRR